jgi:LuxR family maltose regulon positive regulatory protein
VKSIRTANLEIQKIGHESLFRLKRYQGKMAEALDIAKQVEQIDPQGGAWAAALRARLWLAQAEHDSHSLSAAIRWADERRIKLDSENQGRVEQITLARLLIAQHRACRQPDLGLLLRFLDGQLQAAEEKGYVWWMIEALILKALALQARKEIAEALSVLERALALAEPERFFLTFVEQGAPMARLLYQAIECGIAPRESYVGRLLAAFDLQPSRTQAIAPRSTTAATISADAGVFGPDVWIEPLTGRELEVLHLIGAGLSNREIAQELFISLSTVKRHTSKIYGKLNVHNRTQAVARARILGILS